MNIVKYRVLSNKEAELLARLFSEDFPGKDALRVQVKNSKVRTVDENNSLEFSLKFISTEANTASCIPVEGQFPDTDGVMIYILLHVINGIISELEIFKADSSLIIEMPDLNTLKLFHPYSE